MVYSGNSVFVASCVFIVSLPSTHNYNTLDIVGEDINETNSLTFINNNSSTLRTTLRYYPFLVTIL